MSKKIKSALLVLCLLLLVGSRYFLKEDAPFVIDSANFYWAAEQYSIAQDSPHLPGYYFHVQLVRVCRLFVSNTFSVLVPSLLWSVVAYMVFYSLQRLHSRNSESTTWLQPLLGCFVFATNPMVWFYGIHSEMYIVDAVISLATLLLIQLPKRQLWVIPLLALASGFRPTSVVFLLPLVAYTLYIKKSEIFESTKHAVAVIALAVAIMLAWVYATVTSCGGFAQYIELYATNNPTPFTSHSKNIVSFLGYSVWALLFLPILFITSKKQSVPNTKLYVLSIVPALVFFVVVHYNKGYLLLVVPALLLWLLQRGISNSLLVFVSVAQIVVFLFAPFRLPNAEIFVHDSVRTISKLQAVVERTLYPFSSSAQHVQCMNHLIAESDSLLRNIPNNTTVLSDKSFPLPNRTLALLSPTTPLLRLGQSNQPLQYNRASSNCYISGDSLTVTPLLLLSRKDVAKAWYSRCTQPLLLSSQLGLYTVTNVAELQRVHKKMFQ